MSLSTRAINAACDRFLREREHGYAAKQDAARAAGKRAGNFQINRKKKNLPPRECENGETQTSPETNDIQAIEGLVCKKTKVGRGDTVSPPRRIRPSK